MNLASFPRRTTFLISCLCIAFFFIIVGDLIVWQSTAEHTAAIKALGKAVEDEPLKPTGRPTAKQTQLSTSTTSLATPSSSASQTHNALIPPVVNGVAPVISRLETKEPVVFLTIDDGAIKEASEVQAFKTSGVKASLFLADLFIHDNPAFFKSFLSLGALIEDHSITHSNFTQLSYEQQKQEICRQADLEQAEYGRRPVLFRPPGGNYDLNTPRAAAACGMKAVVLWIAKANGGSMQYQIGHSLRPGDIVLMHFRPLFQEDLQAFIQAQNAAGLHTELLEDWLPK